MVQSCSALGCRERYRTGSGITFHSFPLNKDLRAKWILAMKRTDFVPTRFSKICSKHFLSTDFVRHFGQLSFKSETVPSIFDFSRGLQKKRCIPRRQFEFVSVNDVELDYNQPSTSRIFNIADRKHEDIELRHLRHCQIKLEEPNIKSEIADRADCLSIKLERCDNDELIQENKPDGITNFYYKNKMEEDLFNLSLDDNLKQESCIDPLLCVEVKTEMADIKQEFPDQDNFPHEGLMIKDEPTETLFPEQDEYNPIYDEFICNSHFEEHLVASTNDPFKLGTYKCQCTCLLRKNPNLHSFKSRYLCTICNCKFMHKTSVMGHMRLHTSRKQFSYHEYDYKSVKNQVIKIRTRQKPFNCKFCNYKTIAKSTLSQHMKTHHAGEKLFKCKICDYKCVTTYILRRHVIEHVDDKPFYCNDCNYRCRYKRDLQRHTKKHGTKIYQL